MSSLLGLAAALILVVCPVVAALILSAFRGAR